MTGQNGTAPVCSRYVMVSGSVNRMEAALDRNGEHPVLKHLEKYKNSRREGRQRRYADIIEVLEDFANDPQSMSDKELSYLRNDIWELKHGPLRILFGQGTCIDIRKEIRTNSSLVIPTDLAQPDPESTCGRATNAYKKKDDPAPRGEIDLAIGIIGEDKKR